MRRPSSPRWRRACASSPLGSVKLAVDETLMVSWNMPASPRNLRGAPAAQTAWKNDATAITAGGTLVQRLSIGFAQTGGMGGWVATEPTAKVQMMPNATNPVDVEITSIANGATLPIEITLEMGEGI
jgi:hypothetical protein